MNYYLDTEFLEGTQEKRMLGFKTGAKTKPTIDLISIGIVSEDGREYYAISKDFNLKEAWNRYDLKINKRFPMGSKYLKEYWIRENVLKPIFDDLKIREHGGSITREFSYSNLKALIKEFGKTNEEIVKRVEEFTHFWRDLNSLKIDTIKRPIEVNFYTYYGDYDWVAFCWLFGKMIDLPKGFPMYARDLKQVFDDKQKLWLSKTQHQKVSLAKKLELLSVEVDLKNWSNYPKQQNEHNALADARWNKKLHEFLNKI